MDPAEAQELISYIDKLDEQFETLPLLVEGESKIVRRVDPEMALVRLKPTLYSITANRTAVVEGTDYLRLEISRILWRRLHQAGIPLTVRAVGKRSYLSERIAPPPIEVIVKACQIGTPRHIYKEMDRFPTRQGAFLLPELEHEPYVRFDWRNPLPERDECLPPWLADQFIDTQAAQDTALRSFEILRSFLGARQIHLLDICFFMTADGRRLFGEVSPDGMRAKYRQEDLDKDLWRKGKDGSEILEKWRRFLDLIQPGKVDDPEFSVYM